MIRRRLRDVVTIQEYTSSRSASGQHVKTWSDVDTVRARIQSVSGREWFEYVDTKSGGKRESLVSVKVIMRYRDDIKPKMRLVSNSVTYDIIAVLGGDDPRQPLQLMCERAE
jgi:SPP1 family predicted phage head-tail adaptor